MSAAGTFHVVANAGRARAGILQTAHGVVETPVFMPVGTQATVKALSSGDVARLGAKIILGNTYHLALRPGEEPKRFEIAVLLTLLTGIEQRLARLGEYEVRRDLIVGDRKQVATFLRPSGAPLRQDSCHPV